MSVQDIEKVISAASRLGIKSIKLTGGEPLLRDDIEDILRASKRYMDDVSLVTNGTLLEGKAEGLKAAGLDRINVSIDSFDRSVYERITGKLLVERIHPSWLIFSDGFVKSTTTRLIKRLVGLVMSSILLIVISPLLFLVAVAIKLDSRGPVLFRQERVGEDGRIFNIYKFRSMIADAEKESGPVWAENAV